MDVALICCHYPYWAMVLTGPLTQQMGRFLNPILSAIYLLVYCRSSSYKLLVWLLGLLVTVLLQSQAIFDIFRRITIFYPGLKETFSTLFFKMFISFEDHLKRMHETKCKDFLVQKEALIF